MSKSGITLNTIRKLRVLIVENRVETRQVHRDNVLRWGYEPIVAEGSGDTLIQNTLELAVKYCCHLAILDKRLYDDYDNSDVSGLDLVERLKPTSTILITGYADHDSTRAALQKGASDVVAKREGPAVLRESLQRIAEAQWYPKTQIIWPPQWSSKRATTLLAKSSGCHDSAGDTEANDIIARLFPGARRVVLQRLDRSIRSRQTAHSPAIRHNSLIFLAYEDERIPVVVKLLSYPKAVQEQRHYDQFIRGHIEGGRYAHMVARECLWHLGGHVYSFIGFTGTEILTFDDLYSAPIQAPTAQLAADQKLIEILEGFFGTIWRRNNDKVTPTQRSLFELYDHNWNHKLSARVVTWAERPAKLRKSKALGVTLPDPLRWLCDNYQASPLANISTAIVHGDLHGENLLLDRQQFAWVIDYEDTGEGHILRDYVEFAQNILTRLHPQLTELTLLYELAISLTQPRSPTERLVLTQAIQHDPKSLRAFRVVDAVRQFAHRFTRYQDSQEFLWGILLDIAKVVPTLPEHDKRRKRLLCLGGIICYRLDHWSDPVWPPAKWPPVVWVSEQAVADSPVA